MTDRALQAFQRALFSSVQKAFEQLDPNEIGDDVITEKGRADLWEMKRAWGALRVDAVVSDFSKSRGTRRGAHTGEHGARAEHLLLSLVGSSNPCHAPAFKPPAPTPRPGTADLGPNP
jgi:hypothetical protein